MSNNNNEEANREDDQLVPEETAGMDVPLTIKYQHQTKSLILNETSTFSDLFDGIEQVCQLPAHLIKVLFKGKHYSIMESAHLTLKTMGFLSDNHDSEKQSQNVAKKNQVLVLGVSQQELDQIKKVHEDVTVIGFDEEIRRIKGYFQQGSNLLNPHISHYDALSSYKDKNRAIGLLKKLGADGGIMAIMQKRGWKIGTLDELPIDGKVGVSSVCLMGLNTNKGQKISLRLRTDDHKGFREYNSIIQVFLHELVHNDISEHTHEFWHMWLELKREYQYYHSQGHTLQSGGSIYHPKWADEPNENKIGSKDTEWKAKDKRQLMLEAMEKRHKKEKEDEKK